eukprot:6213854-Pleurochrysis_carterae.AAC.2
MPLASSEDEHCRSQNCCSFCCSFCCLPYSVYDFEKGERYESASAATRERNGCRLLMYSTCERLSSDFIYAAWCRRQAGT